MNPFLARIRNEPCLVAPCSAQWFQSCLAEASETMEAMKERFAGAPLAEGFWFDAGHPMSEFRPYNVSGGVLTIPVRGALMNGFPYALGGMATGYPYIEQAFLRGMADENVRGIALVIDSPGGAVAGLFDMVDKMTAMSCRKPVHAFAHESAYSAAYAIASVADEITVSRTGGVGSIGVVTAHVDYSKALADQGITVTLIHAGEHKVDGNAYEPLPEAVRGKIQSRIDAIYDVFVASVARNRDMEEAAVRATEADTFMATEALEKGLADHIGPLEDSLASFAANLNINEGDEDMPGEFSQADLDNAMTEGMTLGVADGAAAERARINTILSTDAAKARPKAALSVALKTDMSAEAAGAFLADLAEEKAEAKPVMRGAGAPEGMFEAAMAGSANPDLGAGGEPEIQMSVADRIMASAGKAKRRA